MYYKLLKFLNLSSFNSEVALALLKSEVLFKEIIMLKVKKLKKKVLKVATLIALAIPMVVASVPRKNSDIAIYQKLSEINVTKSKRISFEKDLLSLSAQEKHYRKPVALRLSTPMERINKTVYRKK